MTKSIKGTKTEKNLMKTFAGNHKHTNHYTYFASAACKEGYEQIAANFEETANQEKGTCQTDVQVAGGVAL